MNEGSTFHFFITQLKRGDRITIYGSYGVEFHGPMCPKAPGNKAAHCGSSCVHVWETEMNDELWVSRCTASVERFVDGALRFQGLALSNPRFLNRAGNPLPLMTARSSDGIYPPADDDPPEYTQEFHELTDYGWIEYHVIELTQPT